MNNNHEKQIKAIESATTDMQRGMAPKLHDAAIITPVGETKLLAEIQFAAADLMLAKIAAVQNKNVERKELLERNIIYKRALLKELAERL